MRAGEVGLGRGTRGRAVLADTGVGRAEALEVVPIPAVTGSV